MWQHHGSNEQGEYCSSGSAKASLDSSLPILDRLNRDIKIINFSLLYVEQSTWYRLPSGVDTVPDHYCCRGAQNRSGSLGTGECGL